MSKCTQKKAKPQWEIEKNRIQVARQKRKIHDILPDEVEEFDAVIKNTRKKLNIPVEPAVPSASPPPRHKHKKLQCQNKAEGDP